MGKCLTALLVVLFVSFYGIQAGAQPDPQTAGFCATTNYAFLKMIGSGKCMAIHGNTDKNDAKLILYDCLLGALNEQFSESLYKYVTGGEDYRYFTARSSGKCITVKNAAIDNNTPTIQYDCQTANFTAQKNQLFTKVQSSKKGVYQLKELNSGRCITVLNAGTTNDSPFIIYDCVDGANQQFQDIFCNL